MNHYERRGVLFLILADLFWACNPTTIALVKSAPPDLIFAGRFGTAAIGFVLAYGMPRWKLSKQELLGGCFFLTAGVAYILAVRSFGIVPTTVFYFLGPIWATLFAWRIQKRRPTQVTIYAVVAVAIGMYLVGIGGFPKSSAIGGLLAVGSGMLNALWIVFGSEMKLEHRQNSNTVMCITAALLGITVALVRGVSLLNIPSMDLGWIAINGVVTFSGLALLIRGQQHIDNPAEISLLLAGQVPLAVLLPVIIEMVLPELHLVKSAPLTRVIGYALVGLAPIMVISANFYRSIIRRRVAVT